MPKALDKELAPYLERIENLKADIRRANEAAASEVDDLKEGIREIYEEVKARNLPVRPLKKLVKWRDLERKQAALSKGLNDDDGAAFALLVEQLGPLGRAAAEQAGHDLDALAKLGRGETVVPH